MKNFDDLDKVALEKFKNGESLTSISKELKVDRTRMTRRLKNKFGIEPILHGRKYSCNDKFFSNINSEKKAYWLGFIFADGCIRNSQNLLEICLAEKDVEHIKKFNSDISSTYKIYKRSSKLNNKVFYSYRLYVVSKQILRDISKFNCIENKTYLATEIYNFNDYELNRAFLRGIFDGDGSISIDKRKPGSRICKASLTSISDTILMQYIKIAEKCLDCKIKYKIYKRSEGSYSLQLNDKNTRDTLLDFLYKDATIYLDRKYNIY